MALGEPKWYTDFLLSKGTVKANSFECPHCHQPISIATSLAFENNQPYGVGINFESTYFDWFEKLPEKLDVGKKVKITSPTDPWNGQVVEITKHYICHDDCSGHFGRAKYEVKNAEGKFGSISVKNCEILD